MRGTYTCTEITDLCTCTMYINYDFAQCIIHACACTSLMQVLICLHYIIYTLAIGWIHVCKNWILCMRDQSNKAVYSLLLSTLKLSQIMNHNVWYVVVDSIPSLTLHIIGTPRHLLVPTHSTRARWASLILGQVIRDTVMMTELISITKVYCIHASSDSSTQCHNVMCI